MMEYRRAKTPGGTFFFTVVTHHRRKFLCEGVSSRLIEGTPVCGAMFRWASIRRIGEQVRLSPSRRKE
jgi:hypothetical protein